MKFALILTIALGTFGLSCAKLMDYNRMLDWLCPKTLEEKESFCDSPRKVAATDCNVCCGSQHRCHNDPENTRPMAHWELFSLLCPKTTLEKIGLCNGPNSEAAVYCHYSCDDPSLQGFHFGG